jgi:hypothetical protein
MRQSATRTGKPAARRRTCRFLTLALPARASAFISTGNCAGNATEDVAAAAYRALADVSDTGAT